MISAAATETERPQEAVAVRAVRSGALPPPTMKPSSGSSIADQVSLRAATEGDIAELEAPAARQTERG